MLRSMQSSMQSLTSNSFRNFKMKRYQLIGRKRGFNQSITVKYGQFHLHSLPYEILIEIFSHLAEDRKTLLSLALVCKKFSTIVNKNFLYKDLIISNTNQFKSFSHNHLLRPTTSLGRTFGQHETSSKINYIESFTLMNPPVKSSENFKTSIAGVYSFDSTSSNDSQNYDEFIRSFTCLLNEAYGLKKLKIADCSSQFSFPTEVLSEKSYFFTSFKKKERKKRLQVLSFESQRGWSIPFKSNYAAFISNFYETIGELELLNFVVDETRLALPSSYRRLVINKLTLSGCTYSNNFKKLSPQKRPRVDLFDEVTHLQLNNILSGSDLFFIDYVKVNNALSTLTIDLDSKIFYQNQQISSTRQEKLFDYAKYNPFFNLLCSENGYFSNLNHIILTNFDIKSFCSMQDLEEMERNLYQYEGEITTLLKELSSLQHLTIFFKSNKRVSKCTRCGALATSAKNCDSVLEHDWYSLIGAFISQNPKCKVKMFDFKGNLLYSRA